jgi:hypothetical protein
MEQYLKGEKIGKSFQEHLQYEEAKARLAHIMEDTEGWIKMTGDKRYGIFGWVKKYEVINFFM